MDEPIKLKPVESDAVPPTYEFLEEPTLPKIKDFKNPENYEFALADYKHKLEVYRARLTLVRAERKLTVEEEKSPFKSILHKGYPGYDAFIDEAEDGTKLPFKPAKVADWVFQNEPFKTDIETGILFWYNGKSWIANAEPYLEKIVATILDKENKVNHYNNILHHLKALTYDRINFSSKIACENGLLDVETQTLTDFNQEEMPFHEIPTKYDPTAKCPNFEEFISQVVNPDDLKTIQEWSGFLLLPDYRFHKLLWIQGEGRNGKGVWQRTMEAVLGEKNVSSINLEEFDGNHRFAMQRLYGKLFNPCSEPRINKELQTNLLKHATGQDTIEAEIKNKQKTLAFRNYAKITVLANRFPKVSDQTTAFKERRLFLSFPNEFIGKDQIQNIENNWLTINDEKSGILNWMLQGLKRLLEQGYFTESKTQQETEAAFLRASDTVGSFLAEMAIFDKTRVTTRSEALDSYKNYCDVLGLDAENDKKFTERLKNTPKISVGLVKKPKQERAWRGLGLKILNDEGKITQIETLLTNQLITQDTEDTGNKCFIHDQITEESSNNRRGINDLSAVSHISLVTEEPKAPRQLGVTSSSNGKQVQNRVCGDCGHFHLPGCSFPNGAFEKVPTDWWAGEFRCWIPRQPETESFADKGEN